MEIKSHIGSYSLLLATLATIVVVVSFFFAGKEIAELVAFFLIFFALATIRYSQFKHSGD